MPTSGELAVFCRPVVMAPAIARRDGGMLAGGWLPDFVRLGELERYLGDGMIEAIAGAALKRPVEGDDARRWLPLAGAPCRSEVAQ